MPSTLGRRKSDDEAIPNSAHCSPDFVSVASFFSCAFKIFSCSSFNVVISVLYAYSCSPETTCPIADYFTVYFSNLFEISILAAYSLQAKVFAPGTNSRPFEATFPDTDSFAIAVSISRNGD